MLDVSSGAKPGIRLVHLSVRPRQLHRPHPLRHSLRLHRLWLQLSCCAGAVLQRSERSIQILKDQLVNTLDCIRQGIVLVVAIANVAAYLTVSQATPLGAGNLD